MSTDLDRRVVVNVFGMSERLFCTQHPDCYHAPDPEVSGTIQGWTSCTQHEKRIVAVPPYSTDIAAAWTVVEHFYRVRIEHWDGAVWTVGFWANQYGGMRTAEADTLPEAICRAALRWK